MNLKPMAVGIIFVFAAILPVTADALPFPDQIPTKLHIYMGGFLGDRIFVDLDNGTVHVRHIEGRDHNTMNSFKPDAAAWSKFIAGLNSAKLYKWAPVYPAYGVMDGTKWSINLEIGNRKFESKGDNNYPTDGDEAKPTKVPFPKGVPFDAFCHAVSQLIGQDFNEV